MVVSGSPKRAVYTTYILPSGGLYATYHFLGEPETTIDRIWTDNQTVFNQVPQYLMDVQRRTCC